MLQNIFIYIVASIQKPCVHKRTNSYLYHGQNWSTKTQTTPQNTEIFLRHVLRQPATVTISVAGSLAFIQSRKTESSPLSPLSENLFSNKMPYTELRRISVMEKGLTHAT